MLSGELIRPAQARRPELNPASGSAGRKIVGNSQGITKIHEVKEVMLLALQKLTKREPRLPRNSRKEPEVPFLIIPTIEDVHFDGDFDFAVLAQSPNYTPASADFIMDIFREYIVEV